MQELEELYTEYEPDADLEALLEEYDDADEE